jgi:serine/threonine-protein kinase
VQKIGRYQILEKLGEGGMGAVYKAYDPEINRHLAIKVLLEEHSGNKGYRLRFLTEARAAGSLSHPNIARVYDVGEENDRPYIAMELLEGKSLADDMGLRRPIVDQLEIAIQIARALDHAHSKGIVHRDIKPSNIIRCKDGIKVVDFGIARFTDAKSGLTIPGQPLPCTPEYMSPEQALGVQPVDSRSDIFSTGCLLYELLSGSRPFDGKSYGELCIQVTTRTPRPIDEVVPGIPASVKLIIERLLKKDPAERFQTCRELEHALAAAVAEIRKDEAHQLKPNIVPIRIRWTSIMVAIVSLTMIIGAKLLYDSQYRSIVQQATEYGSSMVRFMAAESAEKVLSEDWISLNLFIQDAMVGQSFNYLTLVDNGGIIRGSSDHSKIGQPFRSITNGKPIASMGGVSIQRYDMSNSSTMMDFDAPIRFQEKEIGRIHLGMHWDPLEELRNKIIFAVLLLMVVTVAVASIVAYVLASAISNPINILKKSFSEIAQGNLSYRIGQARKDEFGELFQLFDEMAEALQKGRENVMRRQSSKNPDSERLPRGTRVVPSRDQI